MKSAKLNINFSGYTDANLEQKAASILQNMTANLYFPTPIPTLADLQAALTNYNSALVNAADLGRVNVAEKNKARKVLELLLTQLGMYVMYIANGDAAILTSSGYTLSKTPEPQYITNPGVVIITNGITSGQLVSSVKAVKGGKSYLHQVTEDPITQSSVWDSTASSRSSYTFQNLEAGKKYWIRVAVVGSGEQIAYSANSSQYAQ